MKKRLLYSLILLILLLSACGQTSGAASEKIELTISAAASMTGSLLEIKEQYERENPSTKINYNFGGTGTLRRQIEQGAEIDLFFSASEKDYQLLLELGLVKEGKNFLQNQLVVIQSSAGKFESLKQFIETDQKIAIGTPEAVPAGTYTQEALFSLDVLENLQDRMVYTKDVRQVLTFVKEKSVDIGIVYASDILGEENIKLVETIDSAHHEPILYYIAIIQNNNEIDEERIQKITEFYDFVLSEKGSDIFRENGFIVQ